MSGWAGSAWIRSNPLSFTGFGLYSGPLAECGVGPFGVTDEGPSRASERRRRPLALVAFGQGCSRVCSPSGPWSRASISPLSPSLHAARASHEPIRRSPQVSRHAQRRSITTAPATPSRLSRPRHPRRSASQCSVVIDVDSGSCESFPSHRSDTTAYSDERERPGRRRRVPSPRLMAIQVPGRLSCRVLPGPSRCRRCTHRERPCRYSA